MMVVVSLSLLGAKSVGDWTPSREQVTFIEKKGQLPQEAPAPLMR